MKKFLIIFLLLLPSISNALESSFGVGYHGVLYNEKDNLGVINKYGRLLTPGHSQGLSVNYSHLFDIGSSFKIGINTIIGYGWHSPKQSELKIANNYENWNLGTGLIAQYSNQNFDISFKPSFIVNGLNYNFFKKVDIDTGFSFAMRGSIKIFDSYAIFIEPQAIINTATHAYSEAVICPAIMFGFEKKFYGAKKQEIESIEISLIALPNEITPISIAAGSTETSTEVEKPKKLSLKFNDNSLDSKESSDFLQTILNIHNKIPSVINIYHSKGENAKTKADALRKWFLQHEAKEQEVIILEGLKGKEIKIEVNKKQE